MKRKLNGYVCWYCGHVTETNDTSDEHLLCQECGNDDYTVRAFITDDPDEVPHDLQQDSWHFKIRRYVVEEDHL